MQTFWKKTGRELYRRTTLTEAQTRETTDQVLDEAMWESARPWEEKGESLKVNESKMVEQELDEFKIVSDTGQEYVSETQKLAEAQHLDVTQDLKKRSRTHSGQLSM